MAAVLFALLLIVGFVLWLGVLLVSGFNAGIFSLVLLAFVVFSRPGP